jgi:hypothetical protein
MQLLKSKTMKQIILVTIILSQLNNNLFAQNKSKNDTTIVLQNDIYNNFPSTSQNFSSPVTTAINAVVVPQKLTYIELTSKADSLFTAKKYESSLKLFLIAFKNNNDMGQVVHRYKTAICYAKINNNDDAFLQLFRIAEKGNYYNYFEIENEEAFSNLKKGKRWEQLIQIIKLNANKLQNKLSNEIPKRNQ